jgi:hypothetical protein
VDEVGLPDRRREHLWRRAATSRSPTSRRLGALSGRARVLLEFLSFLLFSLLCALPLLVDTNSQVGRRQLELRVSLYFFEQKATKESDFELTKPSTDEEYINYNNRKKYIK